MIHTVHILYKSRDGHSVAKTIFNGKAHADKFAAKMRARQGTVEVAVQNSSKPPQWLMDKLEAWAQICKPPFDDEIPF